MALENVAPAPTGTKVAEVHLLPWLIEVRWFRSAVYFSLRSPGSIPTAGASP